MDSSSSDEPISSFCQVDSPQPKSTARPKGQPRRQQLLRKLGPMTLAVIVGTPNGRWSADLSGTTKQSNSALAHLKSALRGNFPTDSAHGQLESRAAALAIVVIEGWRFVLEYASHDQTFALMEASKATYRQRSGMRFVEHNIIAAATFGDDAGQFADQCADVDVHPHCVVGQLLLQIAIRAASSVRVVRGHLRGQTVSISDCIATWKQVYGVSERAVTAWPV